MSYVLKKNKVTKKPYLHQNQNTLKILVAGAGLEPTTSGL